MKKVLIFWLWKQGRKYIDYFSDFGYKIIGVNQTGIGPEGYKTFSNISFLDVRSYEKKFFEEFNYIIVAAFPYKNQNKILDFLCSMNLNVKIIVEKPVVTDVAQLKNLIKEKNIYYFIDELILSPLYKKICNKKGIDKINFVIHDHNKDHYTPLLEHAFWWFLLEEDFLNILNIVKLSLHKDVEINNELVYRIFFSPGVEVFFQKGKIFLNRKHISDIYFSDSLGYILGLSDINNTIIKKNFYILRKFLHEQTL